MARVLISASSLKHIDKVIKVRIDDMEFTIRIVEEVYCSCKFTNKNNSDEADDSDSQGDSELEISLDPAPEIMEDGEDEAPQDMGKLQELDGEDDSVVGGTKSDPNGGGGTISGECLFD